jgi:hypothetical protein
VELVKEIEKLKKERNAVILAHNYQIPEVQDIADFVGDSLGLSIAAAGTDADVIVFCGVYFMAETAKILSPGKTVLIPDSKAGCPMADMINAGQLRTLKAQYPQAKVLCYVNTTAEVKAECDLCCTSANSIRMVTEVLKDEKEVIFVPDQYLADYVTEKTGRDFILWHGYCPSRMHPAGSPPGRSGPVDGGDVPLCEGKRQRRNDRGDGTRHHPSSGEGKPGENILSRIRPGPVPEHETDKPGEGSVVSGGYAISC